MPESGSVTRRTFLETSATTAAATLVSRHVMGRPAARAAERPHQRGLRRLRHPGPAAAHACAPAAGPADHRGLRPQPQERGLRRVVPLRAARQDPRVPQGPGVGRGGEGLPGRARGGPRARGPPLRRVARRRLSRLLGLPGAAGEGEGPRRRLHHDAGPPSRHDRARGDEGREARDRPQAARQRPPRGAARRPDRARDRRRHPHVLRRGPGVDGADHRVDPGRRDRPGARGAQLVRRGPSGRRA